MFPGKDEDMNPKCPMCRAALTKKTDKGWVCEECKEEIPLQFADKSGPSCGCGCAHNENH